MAAAACASYARSPTCPARWPRPRPRRSRRSATAPSSSSRTSSTAATSRCRCSATATASSSSASATARSSAATRRWSRRHPRPTSPRPTRSALHEAARAAAAAIDYRGAGTVEFLYDAETERFFFLEMNTRLQVEHPVTELVHGVDLVEAQLTVAEGRALDLRVIGETYGHAIEVRLYAEDPAHDWQPQSGVLTRFEVPGVSGEFDLLNRPGLRVDSGLRVGQRGLDALRRDARQGDRLGAVAPGGRPQAGRRARQGAAARPGHQPRPARRDPATRDVPVRRGQHRLLRAHRGHRVEHSRGPGSAPAVRCGRGAGRARPAAPTGAAGGAGRVAQRGLPAAAHRARRRRHRARRRVARRS